MRHAYLVLAHQDGPALRRLVRALRHDGVRFYVHVDARADPAVAAAVRGEPDVALVPPMRVNYKAYSMVEATLRLVRAAMAEGFDYYSLISGTDYPVQPNAHIERVLARSGQQYLSFWRLEDRPSWQHKVQYHYPTEWISQRNPREALPRWVFWAAFRRVRRLAPKRRHPTPFTPYGGSQWWSLTHDCVQDVLTTLDKHPDLARFYRTTESPDEMLFQTIVLNGPLASSVHGYDRYQQWREITRPWQRVPVAQEKRRMLPDEVMNLRYIDWTGELTGEREAPAVLDDRDLSALLRTDCLIARKFDSVRSASLLDALDERR